MENKKLIGILVKDMRELEELIAEIKNRKKYDQLEIEFLHTRAKALLSLMELLENQGIKLPVENEVEEIPVKEEIEPAQEHEPVEEEVVEEKEKELEKLGDENVKEEAKEVFVVEEEGEKEEKVVAKEEDEKEVVVEVEGGHVKEEEEIIEEDEEKEEVPKATIGEAFTSEKSLNDMISEKQKNAQNTLSNRPVSSLKSSIGINDRFLFIRELFDGDGDLYTDTIKSLDKMNSINEAVTFLKNNFKWKKNETSLKFIDLVKRRFSNG